MSRQVYKIPGMGPIGKVLTFLIVLALILVIAHAL